MADFEEPTVLWESARSWKDKKEKIQLEQGSYQGRPTFRLRVLWQTPDGQWRWSQAKPTSSGKTWQDFGLKGKELRGLAKALLEAADVAENTEGQENRREQRHTPTGQTKRAPSAKEQRELDRFDDEVAPRGSAPIDDENFSDLPF